MDQHQKRTWTIIRYVAVAIAVIIIGAMAYIGFSTTKAKSTPTPTKTPTGAATHTPLPASAVTTVHQPTQATDAQNVTPAHTPTTTTEAQPTQVAAAATPVAEATATTETQSQQSPLPSPTPPVAVSGQSQQSPLPAPTATYPVIPTTEIPVTTMYVCGYDRCQDSDAYGTLSFETGISVWENPEPNRGSMHHEVMHDDTVRVVAQKQIYDRPGGLWYQLEDGGWINDIWLTTHPCTEANLSEFSFAQCSDEGE